MVINNKEKDTSFYPTKTIIKELYRSLKLHKRFGTFINFYSPLKGFTYGEYHDNRCGLKSVTALTRNVKMIIGPTRIYNGSFQNKISILKKILSKTKANEIKLSKVEIMEMYTNDYVSKYCEYHKVVPNNMAHGFYYGTRIAIIGTILIYLLMLYFLPIGYILVLMIAYFFIIASEIDINLKQ